jgi:2-(1,2-epoxy-1,2-dihydrophenyl)acetyl-CoA isomerase
LIQEISEGPYLVALSEGVLTLTFNRPEARNAIPTEAIVPLARLFADIAQDSAVRVVLVKAAGDNFGGGGDVAGMAASLDLGREKRARSYWQRLDNASAMVRNWCAIPQPIVTAARGSVAGAAMMYTLGADFSFGDGSTYFLCAHGLIGLSPDSGLSYLLPRAIGVKRAIDMFLSGRKVGADEALSIGLIGRLVAAEDLDAAAERQALALARGPQKVLRDAKAMIAAAEAHGLSAQLELERDKVAENVGLADFEEGVGAFIDKRRAQFGKESSQA